MFILEQQSDVFVDALVSDHRAQVLFLSVYGRDTSIQQLMARLHLRKVQGGVDDLTLLDAATRTVAMRILVGDPARLDKLTGRLPRTGLLGNLLHAWIFDPAVLKLDPANGSGWLLEHQPGHMSQGHRAVREAAQAWRMVKELSPVPLLDHWMLPVLAHLQSMQALIRPASAGPVSALRIELPQDFTAWVSDQVRSGHLVERAGEPREPAMAPAGTALSQAA
ncbi:hypothetical protein [Ideonella sp. YS5]|uniref:hypothetical protein n=1 Tax=Ideonella sp. YS5 TaxID=3453714 RepID=UPI003EEBAECA